MRDIIDAIDLRPKTCVWEVTARCNMRCLHCASDLGEGRTRGTELTLEEARDVCRQLKALGCEQVVLSGGEALLRSDWDAIARELVQLGVGASLISNGLAIDEAIARRVVDVGIGRVALSLDGPEAIHNRIRRHPRAFEGVSRACAVLKSFGLQVNIVTHVNHLNISALPAIEAMVLAWRADIWRLQLASPIGRLSHHPRAAAAARRSPLDRRLHRRRKAAPTPGHRRVRQHRLLLPTRDGIAPGPHAAPLRLLVRLFGRLSHGWDRGERKR